MQVVVCRNSKAGLEEALLEVTLWGVSGGKIDVNTESCAPDRTLVEDQILFGVDGSREDLGAKIRFT